MYLNKTHTIIGVLSHLITHSIGHVRSTFKRMINLDLLSPIPCLESKSTKGFFLIMARHKTDVQLFN
jgi:hypothetical protein